jgi:hypothetical protein
MSVVILPKCTECKGPVHQDDTVCPNHTCEAHQETYTDGVAWGDWKDFKDRKETEGHWENDKPSKETARRIAMARTQHSEHLKNPIKHVEISDILPYNLLILICYFAKFEDIG